MTAGEVEWFYASLTGNFDTHAPMRWNFLLDGLSAGQVKPLIEKVGRLGFTKVEPMEEEGQYILWLAEIRVHSADSFAERVAQVEQFAAREGLVMSDFTVG